MNDAQERWAQTRDINLASALASFVEVEVDPVAPVLPYHDHETGERFCVFRFKPSKLVAEIMRLWADPKLTETHPEHPVAYMRSFMHNRNRYLDAVKSRSVWHMVKKGKQTYFINKEPASE